jgi:uncharacterized protein involved in exopolysaccharide biosynthesis
MSAVYEDYGIPLRELAHVARGHWILPLSIMTLCIGTALAVALLSERVYRSEVAVALETTEGSGLPQALGQFQGVAQAVGLNFGGQGNRGPLLAILDSRLLARRVIQQHQLVPLLLKPDGNGKYGEMALERATEKFAGSVMSVDLDRATGVVTVGIEWTDPVTAANWAHQVIVEANKMTRERVIKDSERALEYLNSEASTVDSLDLKQAIYSLIETQMNRRMLANIRAEYAFVTIDPAVVPLRSIRPARRLLVGAGILAGLILSAVAVVLLHAFSRHGTRPRTAR